MPIPTLPATTSSEVRTAVETAHRFAAEVLRPTGAALDRLDPAAVAAPDSALWNVLRDYRQLGIDSVSIASAGLSPADSAVLNAAVTEELGWGDSGLAISLAVSGFHTIFANLSGNPILIERFGSPDSTDIGCWAVTEPDHGSDSLAATTSAFDDPRVLMGCTATRDGDHYVIRGQKSAWVSNGTIATVATLFCSLDDGNGPTGGGVCIVPLDLAGVSRGAPLDKLGQRALNQGEIIFDEVRVPAEYMVVGRDAYGMVIEMTLALANAHMGATFVGLARAAYELALDYAHERVQGGIAICGHQSVQARLFQMFSRTEAARALARHVLAIGSGAPPPVQYSIASKTFCTNTAFEVASMALQIFGGNGLTREYPIEKLLRDARASMIEDGCNELLGLIAGSKLHPEG